MAKPLIVVPPDTPRPGHIERILVPLDGTPGSAAALAGTIELARGSGVAIVVLHVRAEPRLPMFGDQIAHEPRAWAEEFLARNCPPPADDLELTLRVGAADQEILGVADREAVDLVALGWSQDLGPSRARVVQETLAGSPLPTLLVPVLAPPAGHALTNSGETFEADITAG